MRVWSRAVAVLAVGAVVVAGVPALAATTTVTDAGAAGRTGARAMGGSAALGAARTVATRAQVTPGDTRLMPTTPRTDTPRINNGEITDIEVIGNRVFIAGTFTSITNVGGTAIAQRSLASYNLDTGKVDTGFKPTIDGAVAAVEASPDGSSLYIAGSFNTINGVTKRKIARLNPSTGAPVAAFTATANARATALAVSPTAVYVGGQFATVNGVSRSGLAAVNPTTGAVDTAFNLPLTGGIGVGGMLTVQQLKLTHDRSKLLVVHTGRQIAGQDRYGVALIDTAGKSLLPWRTRLWEDNLSFVGGIQRVFAGDIAPDDSYFVVTSGSGGDRPPINDTAIAYSLTGNDHVEPLWVSRHFDSIYSVAITDTAVYVGGHFSWQESPTSNVPWPGLDNVGYGTGQGLSGYGLGDQVVRRDHLGALDPVTGTALEWNPGSNSYEGEKAMLATSRGLLVGGDGNVKGGKTTGRVAFFDLSAEPAPSPLDTTITTPIEGAVKQAGESFDLAGQALAPAGVSKVQVEIMDRTSGRYLQDDLTTWGAFKGIKATLAEPNATSTTWTLPVSLPAGTYQIQAKTFAVGGAGDTTKAVKKIEAFRFDDLPPSTRISAPAGGLLATQSFVASGTATDDQGVSSLIYSFRTPDNRYLQDDGSVAAVYNTFRGEPDVIGAKSATWQYEVTLPIEGQWKMTATAVDTAGQSDLRGDTRDWTVSATGVPPTVAITAPVAMTPPTAAAPLTVEPGATVTFAGTATDEDALRSVEIYLRNNTTREALAADGTWGADSVAAYHRISPTNLNAATFDWSFTSVPLTPGVYDFRVRATDNLGLTTSNSNLGRLTVTAQTPGDAFPNGRLNFTGTDQNIDQLHLDLSGTATDDKGVRAVRVALRDLDTGRYVQPNGTMAAAFATVDATLADPDATSTAFTLSIDLPTKGTYSVEAWAVDTVGQQDGNTSGATARYLVYPGDLDPTLEPSITPVEGEVYSGGRIVVTGRAVDDVGMQKVELQITNSAGQGMNAAGTFGRAGTWIATFLTSPGSPGSNFAYTSPVVPAGTYTVTIRGMDNYGQYQQPPRTVSVTVTD
ncbi:Ig-like domain-containing protein [Micromonospora sp. WMMD975]|uniref:Ig-like domain-containing protein n=1 Tax=Micromonospora sp. WMMD975 TaxID=3016087 RepID=UPI00249C8F26|nr:Ig-like domain-containing protein [Micromonospora sp. WMMD975]WFE34725.1 Ig-like domain-containing protein [Micromonospora sp. WMMD975]